MEETQNILLNSSINKKSINENASLNIAFSGNKKLLPEDAIDGTIDAYDVYLNEREKSNRFRLIFNINPFCSNVLFNPFTEIIKNEGSNEPIWLNMYDTERGKTIDGTIGKRSGFKWTEYDAIRDTQLSNEKCGFEYHCGIDIFNNHILRSKSIKTVNYDSNNSNRTIGRLSDVYGVKYSLNFKNEETGQEKIVEYNTYDSSRVNERAYSMEIKRENGEIVYTADEDHFHRYLIERDFNTIDDYMRDKNGVIISENFNVIREVTGQSDDSIREIVLPLHLYQDYDLYSFNDCVYDKLIEDNGWYGFSNPSNIDSLSITENGSESLNINKVINNRNYCDFIDMYPGRDLYSFTPKYNEKRKRIEKNWQYFITYPSRDVIRDDEGNDFPFFRYDWRNADSRNISLKAYMIDEFVVDDDGENVLTVYSICQHGLVVGDTVNIYKSDDLFYDSVEVVNVVDKYIFQVIKDDGNMSDKWVEFSHRDTFGVFENLNGNDRIKEDVEVNTQTLYNGVFKYGNKYYPICESNRCNIDENAQDIHFRRVVNGVECKYYVRKFSRLPNFKFKDEEVNDYTLYGKKIPPGEESLIQRFSRPGNENTYNKSRKPINFESHISKLGFANTSYGDDSVEIVFTDDIDTSYLKDNLGRPLSDVYLTIIKNNMGYKKWYGIDEVINLRDYEIEYSHCFGKINSSFVLSDYFREFYKISPLNSNLFDVRDLTVDDNKGLIKKTNNNEYTDEIEFDKDYEYYGDICCYSPVDCDEQIIQNAMCRFNTAQRELSYYHSEAYSFFSTLYHDEIRDTENSLTFEEARGGDPYDAFNNGSLNHTTKDEYKNMSSFIEGYFYQPHYRVPLKTVSQTLNTDNAIKYEITDIKKSGATNDGNQLFLIKTLIDNNFLKNEKSVLYKRSTNEYFYLTVYDIYSSFAFRAVVNNENGDYLNDIDGIENFDDFVVVKKHYETPEYAKLIKDGSCRYCWRNVISNGIESDDKVYPFTNGAFYITKQINFFLRRQGKEIYDVMNEKPEYDFVPEEENVMDYPNFNTINDTNYEPNEIKEC